MKGLWTYSVMSNQWCYFSLPQMLIKRHRFFREFLELFEKLVKMLHRLGKQQVIFEV
jgi:hypothetical protein